MGKKIMGGICAAAAICLIVAVAFAQPPKAVRAKHADRNRDGTVDKKEVKMEHKWEHAQRAKVNKPWEAKADKDNDGVVEKNELAAWKARRIGWLRARSKVNTPLEKRYDANGDGWLEPSEAKEMLRDRHTLIKTDGKAKVDTPLEKEYDTNKDGILDPDEARALGEDLQ